MLAWQIERLNVSGLPVVLFVDEPALCLEDSADSVLEEQRIDALAATLENARTRGAYAGLHCCAARPFERMCRAKPDILSFDADEGLDLFFTDWHALDFVQQGGTVAYGLVPTRPGVNAADAASIFIRWLKAASLAGDPRTFAQRAMITATCGLGLLEETSIEESFGVAHSISKLVKTPGGFRNQTRRNLQVDSSNYRNPGDTVPVIRDACLYISCAELFGPVSKLSDYEKTATFGLARKDQPLWFVCW